MAATGRHSAAGDKTDRLQDILQSSGVSYTQADLDRKPVAQKTGVTAADRYFNKAGLSNPNPTTVAVNANGQAPSGVRVGDTVRTAGGDYEITNALAPGASYNRETGLWSKRTTDQYGTPLETGKNYRYGEEKPGYDSQWQQQIRNAVARLLGYNYDTYKQGSEYAGLERDYTRMGQQAMDDTLGKIAARTGGMASSYAGTASQQAYNDYMQQLEAAARQQYQQERSNQQGDVNLLMALEDQDYGKYRDLLSQWNTDRGFDYGLFSDDYDRRYQQATDRYNRAFAEDERDYNRAFAEDERNYSRGMTAAQLLASIGDNSGYMDTLGIAPEKVADLDAAYAAAQARELGQQDFENRLAAASYLTGAVGDLGYIPPWSQSLVAAAMGGGIPGAGTGGTDLTDAAVQQIMAGTYLPIGAGGGSGGSSGGGSSSRRSSGGGNPGGPTYDPGYDDGGTTPPVDNAAIKQAAYEAALGKTQSSGGSLSSAAGVVYRTAAEALAAGKSMDDVTGQITTLVRSGKLGAADAKAVANKLGINLGI